MTPVGRGGSYLKRGTKDSTAVSFPIVRLRSAAVGASSFDVENLLMKTVDEERRVLRGCKYLKNTGL